jgi:hypothetical protein
LLLFVARGAALGIEQSNKLNRGEVVAALLLQRTVAESVVGADAVVPRV